MLGNKKTGLGDKKAGFGVSGSMTLVSPDTVIVGDIHFSGNLDIEGLVQGNIIALPDKEAFVRVVHGGRVEGEIRVPTIIVNGSVEGDVYSSKHLELAPNARVQGDVFYTLVEMAAGSEVNGALQHKVEQDEPEPNTTPEKLPKEAVGSSVGISLEQGGKGKVD